MSDKPLVVVGVKGGCASYSEWPPQSVDVLLIDWDEMGNEDYIRDKVTEVEDDKRIELWFRNELLNALAGHLEGPFDEPDDPHLNAQLAMEGVLASTSHAEEVSTMGASRLDDAFSTINQVIETREQQGRTAAVALLQAAAEAIKAERALSAAGFQK